MESLSFVHLHTHSIYSAFDGLTKIKDKGGKGMVKAAADMGMTALALTDHKGLYGIVEFMQECKKCGVKPIVGAEMYLCRNVGVKDKEEDTWHLTLLAENNAGYRNLVRLITEAHVKHHYYVPRVDLDVLSRYSEGIIAMSACLSGPLSSLLLAGKQEEAEMMLSQLKEIFPERFFIEIMRHGLAGEQQVEQSLVDLAARYQVPPVATNDVHYLSRTDADAHDAYMRGSTGGGKTGFETPEFYLKSPEQMQELFSDMPYALSNTAYVADLCNVDMKLAIDPEGSVDLDVVRSYLPEPPIPEEYNGDFDEYLRDLCRGGWVSKLSHLTQGSAEWNDYISRVLHELDIIKQCGFSQYLIIVWDVLNHCRKSGILIGPGRGSVTGSLVSYLIGITEVDPIQHGLYFERFLDPGRVTMPDIDVDLDDYRCGEAFDYLVKTYGEDHTARILTFRTTRDKAALKDRNRGMGDLVDNNTMNEIAKLLGDTSIEDALSAANGEDTEGSVDAELVKRLTNDPMLRRLFEESKSLRGLVTHLSIHAAGMVVAKPQISDLIPQQILKNTQGKETVVSQFDKDGVEEVGLLKIDLLALRTLRVVRYCLDLIKQNHGVDLEWSSLPYDDSKAFSLLQTGQATGLFQLESKGQQKNLQSLRPTRFSDIVILEALYRPGPMEQIPDYISRRHGEPYMLADQRLNEVLKDTMGLIIFQEDVIRILQHVAGFSFTEADVVRRSVSKKKSESMEQSKEKFVQGGIANGYAQRTLDDIWAIIERFAGYGFNKAHSTGYSVITMRCAYLKAHYPLEFMCAALSSEIGEDEEKFQAYVRDATAQGLLLLPPDVNRSGALMSTEGGAIRFGLQTVNGVGAQAANMIASKRPPGGYASVLDFVDTNSTKLDKGAVASLIKAGALDCFGYNRSTLLSSLGVLFDVAKEEEKAGGQTMFEMSGDGGVEMVLANDPPMGTLQEWEREVMKISFIQLREQEDLTRVLTGAGAIRLIDVGNLNDGSSVVVGGIVSEVKHNTDRKGNPMMFFKIEDSTGAIDVTVFNKQYDDIAGVIQPGHLLVVNGKFQVYKDKPGVVLDGWRAIS